MSIPRITEILEYFGLGSIIFQASGNTAITYKKAEPNKDWKSLSITNDGNRDLRFAVNGLSITVKPGEVFDDKFEYFDEVQILTNIAYRIVMRA